MYHDHSVNEKTIGTQELMRAEGPKQRPTARYALGRAMVLHATLFRKPRHSTRRRSTT